MVKRIKKKPSESAHLKEKPEDKAWQKWFNQLSREEHESRLHKLGLSNEEIDEWEQDIKQSKSGKKKREEE